MANCSEEVKFFTYFLYFPKQELLYFGRGVPGRYRGCKLGDTYTGPHHNPDVEKALQTEPAIWLLHRKYDDSNQATIGEQTYLSLHWKSGEWQDRPKWLLNRSPKSVGGSFPAQLEGVYKSMREKTHNFFTDEGRQKNREKCINRNKEKNKLHNKSPLMREVTLLNNSIRCCCIVCHKECSRPGMGMHLKKHERVRVYTESGAPHERVL